MMVRRIITWALALVVLAAAPARLLAQFPTQTKLYRYQAVNRDLADVLRGFAADQRVGLVLDPGVGRRDISEEVEMRPQEFLDYICGKYGLVWYFDSASIYVYRNDQLATASFDLKNSTPAELVDQMKSINAYSERYPYHVLKNGKGIFAIAPPRMLQMTSIMIGVLEDRPKTADPAQIAFFRYKLKNASAADQTFDFSGSSVTIPGVATVLQSLVSGQAIPGRTTAILPRDLPKLKGQGLDRYNTRRQDQAAQSPLRPPLAPPTADPPDAADVPSDAADQGSEYQDSNDYTGRNAVYNFQPTIQAEVRTNSVLIRDHPDRIPAYQELLEALDYPTGMIEITAKIIDISKEGGFEWGWPYSAQWGDGQQTQQFSVQLTTTDAANFAVTLMRDQAAAFIHTIKALEREGHANVASRPTLLTMDNIAAQINNSETFYVQVEGSYEVDLFDVSAGTKLKILPHIIEQDGARLIKLSVQIDDGNILEQTVSDIPRVRNDSLTTQAVLRESESLLIGGLVREERSVKESRVPILGRIPGVGFLFRTEEKSTQRIERLILIEPRIVSSVDAQGIRQWQSSQAGGACVTGGTYSGDVSSPAIQPPFAPPVPTDDGESLPPPLLLPAPLESPSEESPATPSTPAPSAASSNVFQPLARIREVVSPETPFRHQSPPDLPQRQGMALIPSSDAVSPSRPAAEPVRMSLRSNERGDTPPSEGVRTALLPNPLRSPHAARSSATRPTGRGGLLDRIFSRSDAAPASP